MGTRRIGTTVAAAGVAVALAVVAIATTATGQTANPPAGGPAPTISVSAFASITTTPDEAVVTFAAREEDPDSVVALNEASRVMNELIAAMKDLGIAEREMETTSVNISQQTLDRGTANERTVFVASSSIEVTIDDFDRIGPAIRGGVEAGATSVKGIRFQVSDPASAKRRALASAVRSARTKADALAEAAGASVTGVVQIREEGAEQPGPYLANARTLSYGAFDAQVAVVPPRDIETEVRISVIWSIG